MVHFVGAGPGAPDLITQRGAALLQAADCIIYAGSLVNPALLGLARADCAIYNSAEMTLEQVAAVMKENEAAHKDTVRLHTGDPCLYGAIREQMDLLDAWGIAYDDTPGVSSFCGAAAGNFCLALYNPSSKGRADYLAKAVRILLAGGKAPNTVCGTVRNIGRTGQTARLLTLAELEKTEVDMFTTVFVGNAATKAQNGKMVTPRGYHGV